MAAGEGEGGEEREGVGEGMVGMVGFAALLGAAGDWHASTSASVLRLESNALRNNPLPIRRA